LWNSGNNCFILLLFRSRVFRFLISPNPLGNYLILLFPNYNFSSPFIILIVTGSVFSLLFYIDNSLSFSNYVISLVSISIWLKSRLIFSRWEQQMILLEMYLISLWDAFNYLSYCNDINTLPSNSMILLWDKLRIVMWLNSNDRIILGTYITSLFLISIPLASPFPLNET
jgi:hypothetical protein